MRHSDPSLTAHVYTDPKLLDVRGALDALPALPLNGGPDGGRNMAASTGTDGPADCTNAVQSGSIADNV